MLEPLRDVLSRLQRTDGTEFELRFTVPRRHFHALRKLFAIERESTYSESTVCFADCNDIRCVDSVWQRKRGAVSERVRRAVSCLHQRRKPVRWPSAGRTVRQHAAAALELCVRQVARRLDKSECRTNVEIEYTPPIDTICDSHSMQALDEPLQAVLCQLSYLSRVQLATQQTIPSLCDYVPFVPHVAKGFPVSRALCKQYTQWMSAAQPTSLLSATTDLSEHLVSVKYDGVRMVLTVLKFDGEQPVVCGLCRRGRLWHLPCTHAPRAMVLDCEIMSNARKIVVFDVFAYDGQHCKGTYAERLCSSPPLPRTWLHGDAQDVLSPFGRERRVVRAQLGRRRWPCLPRSHATPGHAQPAVQMEARAHRGLGVPSRPRLCRARRPPLLVERGRPRRVKPGDIKCRFEDDHIVPMSRRRDKLTANAACVPRHLERAPRAAVARAACYNGAQAHGHQAQSRYKQRLGFTSSAVACV